MVYQIKGWSHSEYEILSSGEIEEYILEIIDFDVMFMTSIEFIDFLTEGWRVAVPRADCEKAAGHGCEYICIRNLQEHFSAFEEPIRKKIRGLALKLADTLAIELGFEASIKYLPS